MRKRFILFLFLPLISACNPKPSQTESNFIRINNYTVGQKEFEERFKHSPYAAADTPKARKEFLDALIREALIVQDAQRKGLGNDKEFLMTIERFWNQSLFTRAVQEKAKEIAGSVTVTENEIMQEYARLKSAGKVNAPLARMREQIKTDIMRAKERRAMDEWVASLYRNADIKMHLSLDKE
jgi:hypothetical protein